MNLSIVASKLQKYFKSTLITNKSSFASCKHISLYSTLDFHKI